MFQNVNLCLQRFLLRSYYPSILYALLCMFYMYILYLVLWISSFHKI